MKNEKPFVIVIGASSGGLAALKRIFSGLPANLPAAVLVVMHIGGHESIMPQILAPYSAMPVSHALNGQAIEPGTILIAPPDCHLLVREGKACLSHGPKENFSRPAIDPLFRSAAIVFRRKAVGVVLTGKLDDGTVGLQAIKAYGGIAIVQDPGEAEVSSMPRSALDHVNVDYCLPLDDIPGMLVKLVRESPSEGDPAVVAEAIEMENKIALTDVTDIDALDRLGSRSMFTCPECHGTLWEIKGGAPQRFRCHTGHAYTALTLATAQNQVAEEAIWAAVRALHERRSLMQRFAESSLAANRAEAAAEYSASADQAAQHAEILRRMISGK